METMELIQLASTIILGLGLFVAIMQFRNQSIVFNKQGIVFNKQLKIATKQLEDQHEWYRREKAISYSSLFHSDLLKTKEILEKEFSIVSRTEPINKDEILGKFKEKEGLRVQLNYYLTYFENVALAIFNGVADEDVLFEMMANNLISIKLKFEPYINYRRRESDNDKLWENFMHLASKWELRRRDIIKKDKLG